MSLSIGARLKSARDSKGVSLEQAARATKIQRRILEAIEQDRVEDALEPVYAKIFLKRYANYLGLDGGVISEEYLATHGPIPPPPLSLETEALRARQAGSPLPKILLPVSIGLVGLIGVFFLGYLALDLRKTLKETQGKAEATSESARQRKTALDSGPKLIVPLSQPLKLTVRTKADVWMQVKSDGAVIFQNVLSKGVQESWTANRELELWTGNASAMELFLNGKPLGSPGSGVMKGIRVTREGLKVSQS